MNIFLNNFLDIKTYLLLLKPFNRLKYMEYLLTSVSRIYYFA
jgi:hypothetical protein